MARGRPFSGNGLDSHVLYARFRTEEGRPDPCLRQSPADGSRRGPRPRFLASYRRESCRNSTGRNSHAATAATVETATVGVSAKMLGVATTTTTAGVTAVVEAGEAHRVLV